VAWLVYFRRVSTGGRLHLGAHRESCCYALVGGDDLYLFVGLDTVVLRANVVVKYFFELLGVRLEVAY